MTVDETIAALQKLRVTHGGAVDVTVWQYGGGLYNLCNVAPAYDPETQTVVLGVAGDHESGARQ